MGTIVFIILILFFIYMFFRKNESVLYIFIFLYPILPEYFAISLGERLPLLTASRCLAILLIFFTLLKNKKISFKYLKDTKFSRVLWVFFIAETVNFIAHNNISENLKEYLGVILENILLVIILVMNIDTEEKKEKCIKAIVFSGGVVFLLSIIEPFLNINLAEFLDTGASDTLLKVTYQRMSLKRATFSFGHPISLAVYSIMIIPLVMYCIDKYNKWIYKIIFMLGICTVLFTISRGQILICALLLITMFLGMKKDERKKYFLLIVLSIIAIIMVCILNKNLMNSFLNIIYSVLNTFGLNFKIENFGDNENALGRFDQLSMLPQVLDKYLLFGGGEGYIKRNLVYVYSLSGDVYRAVSIDCEYISTLIGKGLLGLFSHIYLYYSIIRAYIKQNIKSKLSKALFYSFLGAFLSYFTVNQLTTNRIFWLLFCFVIIEKYYNRKEVYKNEK